MENYTISGRDIVIVGLTPYEFDPDSNILNIAFELSKHNRVLFVNRPTDRYSLVKEKEDPAIQRRMAVLRGKESDLKQVQESFWNLYPKTVLESVNWLAVDFAFDYLNRVNNKRFARQISLAIEKLQFRDIILINDNDFCRSYYMKEYLNPDALIYYLRDYLLRIEYWKKHGTRLEKNLMKQADLVISSTVPLSRYAQNHNLHAYHVGMGCDDSFELLEHEALTTVPEPLQGISHPIVGYAGKTSQPHFDPDFIIKLADDLKTINFVIVSTDNEDLPDTRFALINNIFFIKAKNREELHTYIKTFNACILPKKDSSGGFDPFPRAIFEFLTLGRPVVTFENGNLEGFEDVIFQCSDDEDFTDKLIMAIKEKDPEMEIRRKNFAASNFWSNHVLEIYKAMIKAGIKNGSNTRGKELIIK